MAKLNIENTELNNVIKITPPTIFNDVRGSYIETYNEKIYKADGIKIKFIQDRYFSNLKYISFIDTERKNDYDFGSNLRTPKNDNFNLSISIGIREWPITLS